MRVVVLVILLLVGSAVAAQSPYVAANAPQDKPAHLKDNEVSDFDVAMRPYVEQARASYPTAKGKFEAGLPVGQSFFVTTRIYETPTKFEQVFVAVERIESGVVSGKVWSDIRLINGYKWGSPYSFPESEVLDWLITQPDGSEEGNFVGKFLDTYQR